jgi:hypothetical protein
MSRSIGSLGTIIDEAARRLITLLGVTGSAIVILLSVISSPVGSADVTCRPLKDAPLPVGAREEVIERARDFLLKEEALPTHPYWPGGSSGITLGVGWDVGYHTRAEVAATWRELDSEILVRLVEAAGPKGIDAQRLLPQLRSLSIPRSVAIDVLVRSLRDEYYPLVAQLFPGLERLPAEVQVVFLSVVFNRGPSMGHDPDWRTAKELDRRWEMRRLRVDV